MPTVVAVEGFPFQLDYLQVPMFRHLTMGSLITFLLVIVQMNRGWASYEWLYPIGFHNSEEKVLVSNWAGIKDFSISYEMGLSSFSLVWLFDFESVIPSMKSVSWWSQAEITTGKQDIWVHSLLFGHCWKGIVHFRMSESGQQKEKETTLCELSI